MDNDAHLGPIAPPGNLPNAFIAHVFLPSAVTRQAYIANCYATNTVTLITEYGESFQRVPVGDADLQAIVFPADNTVLGSPVLCITIPLHQQPVVNGVLKYNGAAPVKYKERETRKVLLGEKTSFSFTADGDTGSFALTTKGDTKNIVRLMSPELQAELEIYVQGDVNIDSESFITMLTQEGFVLKIGLDDQQKILELLDASGLSYADNYENKVTLTSEGFTYAYKGKAEKALLGETTTKWLKSLLKDFLAKLTVPTALGPSGVPIDQVTLQKLLTEIDALLSKRTSFA